MVSSEKCLVLTQYAGQHQQHQAETQQQQQQQDEVSGQLGDPGEGEKRQAGATLSGLQVLLHRVRQAVGLRTVTQLSTGLVDLEGVAHGYVPHLQWKICVKCIIHDASQLRKAAAEKSRPSQRSHRQANGSD